MRTGSVRDGCWECVDVALKTNVTTHAPLAVVARGRVGHLPLDLRWRVDPYIVEA